MPTYEVTSPDGKIFEVTAPEGASEQDVLSYAQSQFGQQEVLPQEPVKEKLYGGGKVSEMRAALAGAGDIATMGFSDEIKAGLQGLVRGGLDPNLTTGEAYDFFLNKARQEGGQLQEQNRKAYLGGQIAGGLGTAIAIPAGALTKFGTGKAAQYATGSGIGALSGGLYGYGSGEGSEKERAKNAAWGGLFGATGGAGGVALGGLAQRAIKAFTKKPVVNAVTSAAEEVLPISNRPVTAKSLTQTGEATTLLKGAKTGNIDLMRQEEMARQGLLGSELEAGIRGADETFKQSVKDTAQKLAGSGTKETAQDTLTEAVAIVKNRFNAQKKLQSSIMGKRNDAIAKAKVYGDYTRETLGTSLKELRNTPDMKVNLMRGENKPVLDDLKILEKLISGKNLKSVNMSALGAWRSGLNTYKQGTQQSVLASKAAKVYDDWLDNHLKLAIKEGDEDLANTIFSANQKYAEFKNKYGTNSYKGQKNIIEKIMQEDEMTPRAMVNTVFGKSLDGKDYTEQYVKRMIETMPEGVKRQSVVDGFRAGLYQKSFEDAYDATTDTINLGKFKNNLIKMKKNDAFNKYLTTPENNELTDLLIQDIAKYQRATSDRSIVNLSGTTPMAARIMQTVGAIPIIRNLSLARGAAEGLSGVAKAGANAKNSRAVEKSLADFYKTIAPEIDNQVKFNFSVGGGALLAPEE